MRELGFVVGTGSPASRVAFRLRPDSWDDYNYRTTFNLFLYDDFGTSTQIGRVKILQMEGDSRRIAKHTSLESQFPALPEGCISLGQGEEYYRLLREHLGTEDALRALAALRDVAVHPELASDFEGQPAYRNSLVRENAAQRALASGRGIVLGESAANESFSFSYELQIEGADAPVEVQVDFDADDPLPGRLVAVIGANATGKTRLLAHLGEDLAQLARASAESVEGRLARFHQRRPRFARVVALSFSPFDQFKRPKSDGSNSYVYCGVTNREGRVSDSSLVAMFEENRQRVNELGRDAQWHRCIEAIYGLPENAKLDEPAFRAMLQSESSALSSGQAILAQIVTALVAWLSKNSIVLFDEPEMHLHPNALAILTNVLGDVLQEFDSYCLVATHSPVVIQQVPAKRVILFTRTGNLTVATPLEMESLGESVSELTRHVFGTVEVDSTYRRVLADLASKESIDEVLSRFHAGLGMNARAYLMARYAVEGEQS